MAVRNALEKNFGEMSTDDGHNVISVKRRTDMSMELDF